MIPLLLLLTVGVGQTKIVDPCEGVPITHDGKVRVRPGGCAQPAPLKCGKYEHVENVCSTSTGTCSDKCVDDIHPLKESEYQEIMERLKKLEKDSVRMTEPVIACDDPQNAKGCKWLPNPNVLHTER